MGREWCSLLRWKILVPRDKSGMGKQGFRGRQVMFEISVRQTQGCQSGGGNWMCESGSQRKVWANDINTGGHSNAEPAGHVKFKPSGYRKTTWNSELMQALSSSTIILSSLSFSIWSYTFFTGHTTHICTYLLFLTMILVFNCPGLYCHLPPFYFSPPSFQTPNLVLPSAVSQYLDFHCLLYTEVQKW